MRTKAIANDSTIEYIRFDLSSVRTYSENGKQIGGDKTGQRIQIGYKKENPKTGTFKRKEVKDFIAHVYCPFCGKKY